jgi:glycine/D-amino acid oxidase-like deaminating enzyme
MVPAWSAVPLPFLESVEPDKCPLLSDVCAQLRDLVQPLLQRVSMHTGTVQEIRQELDGWTLRTAETSYKVRKLILCTGADPRTLNLPKPSIPLDVALCPEKLRSFVRPESRIVVFGTSHSGTLVLRNLRAAGCRNVKAIYRDAQPFRWLRDGDTEGLKQESAAIADEIVGNAWGDQTPILISLSDTSPMLRAAMEADAVIYAMGFQRRVPRIVGLSGTELQPLHDPKTAQIFPACWGFGIGFPGVYTTPSGTQAPDVGFVGFIEQIRACMPAILT